MDLQSILVHVLDLLGRSPVHELNLSPMRRLHSPLPGHSVPSPLQPQLVHSAHTSNPGPDLALLHSLLKHNPLPGLLHQQLEYHGRPLESLHAAQLQAHHLRLGLLLCHTASHYGCHVRAHGS